MDDAQDTFLMSCFRDENGSYSLGANSRAAIATCEQKYDSFSGGPRWHNLKRNLDDYDKCITEARAQMASGNFAKFGECAEISNRGTNSGKLAAATPPHPPPIRRAQTPSSTN